MPQSLQVFSVRGFEALFPCTGTLGCTVCLAPQLFFLVYLYANVGPPSSSSCHLATSPLHPSCPCLPLLLVWMSDFNSLVVRLPYSSIFCQFWLVFVFKFLVVFLLFMWGGTVCLPMPPCWPEVPGSFESINIVKILNEIENL